MEYKDAVPRTFLFWLSFVFTSVVCLLLLIGIYGSAIIILRRRLGIGSGSTWFERVYDRLNDPVVAASELLWKFIRAPLLAGLRLLLIGLPLGWLIAVFYLPHSDAALEDLSKASDARTKVSSLFMASVPSGEIRLQQHGGFNLDIWIRQHDIESVPYPDRKNFIQRIGQSWCEDSKVKTESVFLPSVQIRDVRTGKEWASYSCTLSHASIN
jgi:hypothetical protein